MKDASGLQYFLTDHLGSVIAVTNSSGTLTSQQRYLPFGQERADVGTIAQTDYGYTGQRDNTYIKLIDYRSRWYDPYINHFIQPDSIILNLYNPQNLNRYSYVSNQPINFNDPSGHMRIGDGPQSNNQACTDEFYCANGKPHVRTPRTHSSTNPRPQPQLNPISKFLDGFNWNIQSPNVTTYQDPGFAIFGGFRIREQVGATINNGSNLTVSITPEDNISIRQTTPIDGVNGTKGTITVNSKLDSTFGYTQTAQGEFLSKLGSSSGFDMNFNPWKLSIAARNSYTFGTQ